MVASEHAALESSGGVAAPVTLRPLAVDALGLVATWLDAPHVRPYWSHDVEAEIADMRTELMERGDTVYRLVLEGTRPVGLLFRYRIHAYPEYADELRAADVEVPTGAWSVDYLIGEADVVGRGIGSRMLRVACEELWREEPDASCLIVPVHADNERSWRLLGSVGFTRLPGIVTMTPDNDDIDGRHIVSRLDRPHPHGERPAGQ